MGEGHEKERYYTLKDRAGKPQVVVCLIKNQKIIVRGVAVCSRLDTFAMEGESNGKDQAYRYALEALTRESDDFVVVRNRSIKILRSVEGDWKLCGKYTFNCHSYYSPKLSHFEKALLSVDVVS